VGSFLFAPSESLLNWAFARNKEFTFEVRYVRFVFMVSKNIPAVRSSPNYYKLLLKSLVSELSYIFRWI